MRKSRLKSSKRHRLIEFFISESIARTAIIRVGVHRNTATHHFQCLLQLICQAAEDETPFFSEIEGDGSYFWGDTEANAA